MQGPTRGGKDLPAGQQHPSSTEPASKKPPPTVGPGDIAIGVVIGRASENFDFFVYAIASVLVFPSVFFPQYDPLQGTLYSFLIFAFAFVARPFGTIAFMTIQ